jgi:GNAT superfamily N-acetyltransferase
MTGPRVRYRSVDQQGEEPRETFEEASVLCSGSGLRYATPGYLLAWSMTHRLFLGERDDTDEIIAVLMAQALDSEDVAKWNSLLPWHKRIRIQRPAIYISDIVVAPPYRRQNIGTEFLGVLLNHSRVVADVACSRVYALARVPSTGETKGTSLGPLVNDGFREAYRFRRFYADCDDEFVCSLCCDPSLDDRQVCSCEARLMVANIEEEKEE